MPLLSVSATSSRLLLLLISVASPQRGAALLAATIVGEGKTDPRYPNPISISALSSTSFSGGGWDNDNFLESLSKRQEEPPSWGPPPLPPPPSPTGQNEPEQRFNVPNPSNLQQPPMQQYPSGIYSSPPPAPVLQQQYQQQVFASYRPPPPPVAVEVDTSIRDSEDGVDDDFPPSDLEEGVVVVPLTQDMKTKIKATNEAPEEEASQGGVRFRKLMERAKQQQQMQQQQQHQPASGSSFPQKIQQQIQPAALQIPPNAFHLPVEEQARLFRELIARQQLQQMHPSQVQYQQLAPPPTSPSDPTLQPYDSDPYQQQHSQVMQTYHQQQQHQSPPSQPYQPQYVQQPPLQNYPSQQPYYPPSPPPPPPPQMAANMYDPQTDSPYSSSSNYLEHGVGFDGRRIGRNRDADIIANTADAYLAKLKRDSTTRNLARYAGDDARANDIFHDPAIQRIQAPELNPYLAEQRKRERDMLETVPEEMLLFQEYHDKTPPDDNKTYSRISYKDQVAQLKTKRNIDNR
jgi:hypothetical protein